MVRSSGQSTLLWLQQHTLRVLDLQTKRGTALPSSRQVALLAVEPPSPGGSERGVPGGRVGAAQHIATVREAPEAARMAARELLLGCWAARADYAARVPQGTTRFRRSKFRAF